MTTDPPTPLPPRPPRPRGRVFDVVAPGKTLAYPTSRPVVIGHKPQAQQAQVSVSGIGEPERRDLNIHEKPVLTSTGEEQITSSENPGEAPAVSPRTTEESQPVNPAHEQPTPGEQAAPATTQDALAAVALEPEEPAPPLSENTTPLPAVPDEPMPDDDVAPPSIEHQVVVSHHTTAPRSTGKFIGLILLAIFFVVVVVDILMDAGIISTSLPHTHFF